MPYPAAAPSLVRAAFERARGDAALAAARAYAHSRASRPDPTAAFAYKYKQNIKRG
jgi:hypothetical protein